MTEQERSKHSSIKIRDKRYLLSYDREITVSRRRQKDHGCRVSEDNNSNYQSAGPEIKEIWSLEAGFETSSGIKRSTVEGKEKCTSTYTKRATKTRPIKWLSSG